MSTLQNSHRDTIIQLQSHRENGVTHRQGDKEFAKFWFVCMIHKVKGKVKFTLEQGHEGPEAE